MSEARIRGRRLQEVRRLFFGSYPLCVMCDRKGIVKAATELDHKIPLFKGGTNDPENLQGLCSDCHKIKTAQDVSRKAGCDENGYPEAWQ